MVLSPRFSRHLVQLETRLLIESACTRCGASKLVSTQDGSLEEWELDHARQCAALKAEKPAQGSQPEG